MATEPSSKLLQRVHRKRKINFFLKVITFLLFGLVLTIIFHKLKERELDKANRIDQIIKEQNSASHTKSSSIVDKRSILLSNIELAIQEGEQLIDDKQYKEGIKKIYFASTVIPDEIGPQLRLIKAYKRVCEENNIYCGNIQKALKRAYNHAQKYPQRELYEAELDVILKEWNKIMKKKSMETK